MGSLRQSDGLAQGTSPDAPMSPVSARAGTGGILTFDPAFVGLPAPQADWDGRCTLGRRPLGAVTLAELAAGGAALDGLVAAKRAQAAGGDDRLGCAYLVGGVSWELGKVLGGLWLGGWHVGQADPAAVALSVRYVDWAADGAKGTTVVLDLTLDPDGLVAGAQDPGNLAQVMVYLHGGLIATLAATTGLGAAAQWRVVGDGLCGALLAQGKAMGCVPAATTLGRAILADPGTKLHARQSEYVEVSLPGNPVARDWFLLRGGCCRFYTSDGGDYCATCVLRKRDDQIARLRDHLAATRPA